MLNVEPLPALLVALLLVALLVTSPAELLKVPSLVLLLAPLQAELSATNRTKTMAIDL